jgi:hypothetical protein
VNKVKKTFKTTHIRPQLQKYVPISTRLPIYLQGATPPRPDPGHLSSTLAGVAKRVATATPTPNRKLRREFSRFVDLWMKRNLKPLTTDEMMDFETWLASTTYGEERKRQLRDCWEKCGHKPSKKMLAMIKAFVKDETYTEFKFPRGIYSRSDQAKCLFGPLVQSVSKKLFDLPWFIKKIPVADRPMAIYERLHKPGSKYIFTDYTSFEAHFTADLMNACENRLYRYMTSRLSRDYREVAETMSTTKIGQNNIIFKTFNCKMKAGRMSGEMDTSASNGFTNLMLYLYASFLEGCSEDKVHGFVEGDDGIFRNDGPAPTQETFEKLGMTIKIGETTSLETASFCGQIYDIEDMPVVTDIKEVIARLGWTNKKYIRAKLPVRMELLRSRGYSLVYQYGGCPILGILGVKILELTSGHEIRQSIISQMDEWERERLLEAMKIGGVYKTPGMATRQLVERMYDISISEQLDIERKIESMVELGPLPFKFESVPEDWITYFNVYNVDHLDETPVWIPIQKKKALSQLVSVGALTVTQMSRILGGGDDG